MQILINGKTVTAQEGETILKIAERIGYSIPTLCYADGAKHKSSCMVCAVKNTQNGQIIPSCSTVATDGMQLDTESDEIQQIRLMSLELLLSDHRADCEAPCSMVCPKGLDVERMLSFYDAEDYQAAYDVIAGAFQLPEVGCDSCKAPCEKACRRGTVDEPVAIRKIIHEVVDLFADKTDLGGKDKFNIDKKLFQSKLGRFSDDEKERLKETVTTKSSCLHCACSGKSDCKLREYSSAAGIKRTRYGLSSTLPVMQKEHVTGNLWFEQAKCVRCGLCVYNSTNGFTFKDRGFGMQVVIPTENKGNVSEKLAQLCPSGALYFSTKTPVEK
ncbi:2Fe-2S iron-sulfur cluster-binding protein [Mangrovibacterium marinum]|uniref:Dihydroprymidine dehydrogenase-like protein n=1 Tax=Mangrovibacterium marinum TaxID=1639118 RepID=A0A2T5C0T6_9BACT|nr:2Fe-2S iron-sulfur cluster-binding protein [Mangrovibacterium marinum]PTN08222.1 dihydroprymidine dehydrogenase-like protein [Mangrovibacterium marinum]